MNLAILHCNVANNMKCCWHNDRIMSNQALLFPFLRISNIQQFSAVQIDNQVKPFHLYHGNYHIWNTNLVYLFWSAGGHSLEKGVWGCVAFKTLFSCLSCLLQDLQLRFNKILIWKKNVTFCFQNQTCSENMAIFSSRTDIWPQFSSKKFEIFWFF